MKKLLLLLAFVVCMHMLYARDENKGLFIYKRIYIESSFFSSYLNVATKKWPRVEYLRNEKKQVMKFTSEEAILLYFQLQGWEVYSLQCDTTNEDSWILRKRCTQEEAEEIVRKSVK